MIRRKISANSLNFLRLSAGKFFGRYARNRKTIVGGDLTSARFYDRKRSGKELNKYYSSSTGSTGHCTGHSKELSCSPSDEEECDNDEDYGEMFIYRCKPGDYKPLEIGVRLAGHKGIAAESRFERLKSFQCEFENENPEIPENKMMHFEAQLDTRGEVSYVHNRIV